MKRILVTQASLEPPAGANGIAAWIVQALKDENAVSLLTWKAPRLERVNHFFGTSLDARAFEVLSASLPGPFAALPLQAPQLRDYLLMRECRAIAAEFDLVITAMGEADLGDRGIQYVHHPRFDSGPPEPDGGGAGSSAMTRFSHALAERLTGFSRERMKRNLTLANSEWTATRLRRLHGLEAHTVHPPVAGSFPDVPWEKREDSFVCIGRLAPEKRLERVIAILGRVRQAVPQLVLNLVGSGGDDAYARKIRGLARQSADWVRLHENVPRQDLIGLIVHSRYGIHGRVDEPFGMAVAELVRGGCITFVPDGGGQMEIVGVEPVLIYRNGEEAVEKIAAVLEQPASYQPLRLRLAERAQRFSSERFASEVRAAVKDFA